MSGKKYFKVLLVDNEEDFLDVFGNLLEMDGHTVKCATGYNEALALVESEDFDIVVTDYSMPGMHGIFLLEMVKDVKPNMPVIIVTAYGNEEINAKAKRKGADLVLNKPFKHEELVAGIRKALKKWQK